jgi:hypothetical protein
LRFWVKIGSDYTDRTPREPRAGTLPACLHAITPAPSPHDTCAMTCNACCDGSEYASAHAVGRARTSRSTSPRTTSGSPATRPGTRSACGYGPPERTRQPANTSLTTI